MRCVQAVLQCDARAVLRASSSPVIAISLTTNGLPCLTLANAHAYAFHTQLEEWMRVADWGFPASAHHSVMAGGSAGEISSLLAAAEAQRPRAAIFDAMQVVRHSAPHPPRRRLQFLDPPLLHCRSHGTPLPAGDVSGRLVQDIAGRFHG